jgi:hypothetical protein
MHYRHEARLRQRVNLQLKYITEFSLIQNATGIPARLRRMYHPVAHSPSAGIFLYLGLQGDNALPEVVVLLASSIEVEERLRANWPKFFGLCMLLNSN